MELYDLWSFDRVLVRAGVADGHPARAERLTEEVRQVGGAGERLLATAGPDALGQVRSAPDLPAKPTFKSAQTPGNKTD